MHASVNVGCQDKSGPGKIHEVILVCNKVVFKFTLGLHIMCALTIMLHWYSPSVPYHAQNTRVKDLVLHKVKSPVSSSVLNAGILVI